VNDGLGEPSPGPILRYAFNETSGLIAEDSGVDGANPIYNPNTSVANIVKKSPPGGPYDANNKDIVNGKDYSSMAFTWQDLVLWPAP
jgi:hypothetical protein